MRATESTVLGGAQTCPQGVLGQVLASRRRTSPRTSVARTLAAQGSRKTGGADEGPALAFETISTWDSRVAATLCGRVWTDRLRSPTVQAQVAVSAGAGPPMTGGVSSRCLSRRRSAVACRCSSHATSGSRGCNRPSRRTSTTSVKRQVPRPVGFTSRAPRSCFCRSWAWPCEPASGLDPVDAGVGAEAQSQQPQYLVGGDVGGDADRGRSGPRRVHLADTGPPAGVVAVVGHMRPDLACGPVDLDAAHHPHQWSSPVGVRSPSNRLQYPTGSVRGASSTACDRKYPRSAALRGLPSCLAGSSVAGCQSRPKSSSGRSGTLTRGFGSWSGPSADPVTRTRTSSSCCRMPRLLDD